VIDALASIIFDTNAPLDTPAIFNTIDAEAPTSAVAALPSTSPPSFTVSWSISDGAGSGAGTFDVFVSDDGGPFTLLLDDTPLTSTTFNGEVDHTYAFYSVATDGVGFVETSSGIAQATTLTVATASGSAALVDDPLNPGRQMLVVSGTSGDDVIRITRARRGVRAVINGVAQGIFNAASRIEIFGDAGDDSIDLAGVALSVVIRGGAGNDTVGGGGGRDLLFGDGGEDILTGRKGADILLGGDGNDMLAGDVGADLLIGGDGIDTLTAGKHSDLLIGGSTLHDGDETALRAILDEWRSRRSYDQRVANLVSGGGGGLNGTTLLDGASLVGDSFADILRGGKAQDWFLSGPNGTTPADNVLLASGERLGSTEIPA
jgi:Ca2+-binding RTX toxin-like protein